MTQSYYPHVTTQRPFRLWHWGWLVLMALVGCSSGPSETSSPDTARVVVAPVAENEPTTLPILVPPSPVVDEAVIADPDLAGDLRTLLGVFADLDEVDEFWLQHALAVENLKAPCMQAAGFEYAPEAKRVSAGPLTAEEVARVGFGVSTLLPANEPTREISIGDEAYLLSLQMDEQLRYLDSYDRCEQEAISVLRLAGETPWLTALASEAEAVRLQANASPDVSATAEGGAMWSACMAEAGYDQLRNFGDAQASVEAALRELAPGYPFDVPPGSPAAFELAATPDFQDLQQHEIDLALLSHGCQQQRLNAWFDAMIPLIDRYVDDNRERLLLLHEELAG